MSNVIHFAGTPGQIAYEAWSYEFQDAPYDSWYELSGTAQEAWEEIAEATRTQSVILPKDGFEVSFRTPNGTTTFAWSGAADTALKDALIERLWIAMSGGK